MTQVNSRTKLPAEMRSLILATVANLFATGAIAHDSPPPPDAGSEHCYGIAKAGRNACATAKHSCAGVASKDNAPDEWIDVAKGTCKKRGGQLAPPRTQTE